MRLVAEIVLSNIPRVKTKANRPGHLTFFSKVPREFYKHLSRFAPCAGPYDLTISGEKKFIWFQVAKVGTRTIIGHFRENGVKMDVEDGYKIYYNPRAYRGYLKFSFVRNPWDRMVSCWINRVLDQNYFKFKPAEYEKMKRFENFIEFVSTHDLETCNRHLRIQRNLIDVSNLDFLGRLETFTEDFRNLCGLLGIKCDTVRSQNVSSKRKKYQEYYDAKLREKVFQLYRKDIQIFGYQF